MNTAFTTIMILGSVLMFALLLSWILIAFYSTSQKVDKCKTMPSQEQLAHDYDHARNWLAASIAAAAINRGKKCEHVYQNERNLKIGE